jgi:TatA/E family protein of Tat protein translocase
MGPLGFTEIAFILVIALLLFGPNKLPELGRLVGKALREFRRASTDLRATIEDEVRDLERAGSLDDKTIHRPPADPSKPGSV